MFGEIVSPVVSKEYRGSGIGRREDASCFVSLAFRKNIRPKYTAAKKSKISDPTGGERYFSYFWKKEQTTDRTRSTGKRPVHLSVWSPGSLERIPMRAIVASKFLKSLPVVLLLLNLAFAEPALGSGRFRIDPDIVGKIVDLDTGQPLAGVVVMAVWTTDVFRLVIEPKTEYYDYFETLTGENGGFKIPGKGMTLFKKINPPKVLIFKSGYGAMHLNDLGVYFKRDSPLRDRVKWVEGKPVISFRKESVAERKRTIQRLRGMPFNEMAVPGMPEEKYRLYKEEATHEYHALGMTPYWERDSRYIRVKSGGVSPAQDVAVEPAKRER
jgi:hypothetical protein